MTGLGLALLLGGAFAQQPNRNGNAEEAKATLANAATADNNGLITKQSRYSAKETIARFEEAVKAKEANGYMVFPEIDHAAAAKKFGIDMLARTVIVFGNPQRSTAILIKTPTLAIDVPAKALVWQDEQGRVWLTYNSAEYLGDTIYPRHGLPSSPSTPALAKALVEFSDYATK